MADHSNRPNALNKVEIGYFEKDTKYDKGYYILTCRDATEVTIALIFYFIIHILLFWGHIALGTTHPEEAMWLYVALFASYIYIT